MKNCRSRLCKWVSRSDNPQWGADLWLAKTPFCRDSLYRGNLLKKIMFCSPSRCSDQIIIHRETWAVQDKNDNQQVDSELVLVPLTFASSSCWQGVLFHLATIASPLNSEPILQGCCLNTSFLFTRKLHLDSKKTSCSADFESEFKFNQSCLSFHSVEWWRHRGMEQI